MLFFNIKRSMAASALVIFSSLSSASFADSSDLPPAVEPGFYWTDWLDSDKPTLTGDWEILAHFGPEALCEYPVDIEAKITDDELYHPLDTTPDTLIVFDASKGLICRNADQLDGECSDYKVRFMCQVGTWTGWLNADRPSLSGDWETLDSNDTTVRCENPTDIRARVVGTNTVISNITSAPDKLAAFGLTGLACKNADQADNTCEDYEIRFLCPDGWNSPEVDAVESDEADAT